jgi:ribosome-associated protein
MVQIPANEKLRRIGHLSGRRQSVPEELAHKITDILSDMQAEDILLLDISSAASFADFFVIASAGSDRQLGAILDEIDMQIRKGEKLAAVGREGEPASGWVLLDYGRSCTCSHKRASTTTESLWATAVAVRICEQ